MVVQSCAPVILLTRPLAQSMRFAATMKARFAGLRIVISPLLAPAFLAPALPGGVDALIFTSETGVEAFRRLSAGRSCAGARAWCVGDRTAAAARAVGLVARSAAGDATALVAAIRDAGEAGPLLHLRGAETRGNIAESLISAGLETLEAVVYAQVPQPLSSEALRLLHDAAPIILPLFSPRTAALFVSAAGTRAPAAPLWVAAMSGSVVDALAPLLPQHIIMAERPDALAMADVVATLIAAARHA